VAVRVPGGLDRPHAAADLPAGLEHVHHPARTEGSARPVRLRRQLALGDHRHRLGHHHHPDDRAVLPRPAALHRGHRDHRIQGVSGQQPAARTFPEAFLWGAATSAYQIEGSLHADGRGPSVWDEFARRPGAIEGGGTAEIACDSYRRWADDVELVAGLGLNAYRFSVGWSRIVP